MEQDLHQYLMQVVAGVYVCHTEAVGTHLCVRVCACVCVRVRARARMSM